MGFKMVSEAVRTTFTPTAEVLEQCRELDRTVAEAVLAKN
jgi:hypothetical protein